MNALCPDRTRRARDDTLCPHTLKRYVYTLNARGCLRRRLRAFMSARGATLVCFCWKRVHCACGNATVVLPGTLRHTRRNMSGGATTSGCVVCAIVLFRTGLTMTMAMYAITPDALQVMPGVLRTKVWSVRRWPHARASPADARRRQTKQTSPNRYAIRIPRQLQSSRIRFHREPCLHHLPVVMRDAPHTCRAERQGHIFMIGIRC